MSYFKDRLAEVRAQNKQRRPGPRKDLPQPKHPGRRVLTKAVYEPPKKLEETEADRLNSLAGVKTPEIYSVFPVYGEAVLVSPSPGVWELPRPPITPLTPEYVRRKGKK